MRNHVEDIIEQVKLDMLSKMVHMTPRPRDESGNLIPIFRKEDGTTTSNYEEVADRAIFERWKQSRK